MQNPERFILNSLLISNSTALIFLKKKKKNQIRLPDVTYIFKTY